MSRTYHGADEEEEAEGEALLREDLVGILFAEEDADTDASLTTGAIGTIDAVPVSHPQTSDQHGADRGPINPVYLYFVLQNENSRKFLLNRIVEKIGGSEIIHVNLYLPRARMCYTADLANNGSYSTFTSSPHTLAPSEHQIWYEAMATDEEYDRIYADLQAKENWPYDKKSWNMGWLDLFCSHSFMENNCVTPGTQICSRYIYNALVEGGVIPGPKIQFLHPTNVYYEAVAEGSRFSHVTRDEMVEHSVAYLQQHPIGQQGFNYVAASNSVLGRSGRHAAGSASDSILSNLIGVCTGSLGLLIPPAYAQSVEYDNDDEDTDYAPESGEPPISPEQELSANVVPVMAVQLDAEDDDDADNQHPDVFYFSTN